MNTNTNSMDARTTTAADNLNKTSGLRTFEHNKSGANTSTNAESQPMTPEIEEALGKDPEDPMSNERFIGHPYSSELYDYLRRTPKDNNYMLTPAVRKEILHRVSWFLLSKDDRLADLVPLDERTGGAPREELQDELEVPIEYTEVRRGQPCGHVFKRGEGVYRCKNCSMDDTCVLCTRCFQATDHTGHETSFSVNSGTGGCCDCGDPEAWGVSLRCRHHSSFEALEEAGVEPIVSSAGAPFVPGYNNSECPVSVKQSIELTIAVVLEFILETFSTSPVALSRHIDEASIMEDAMNTSMAIGDHEQPTMFAAVLWNDEVHSFQDVIDQCTEALQCSVMEAKKIAMTVDMSGRDVLHISTSILDLIDIATTMTNVSLSVSIRAARDVFREQLSASLLIWLRDLACCKFRPLGRVFQGKINNEIRAEISHQLCLRWVAPYRSEYLADLLEKQYNFNLPESDCEDDDDDDDEDEDDDDDCMDEDDCMDDDDLDINDIEDYGGSEEEGSAIHAHMIYGSEARTGYNHGYASAAQAHAQAQAQAQLLAQAQAQAQAQSLEFSRGRRRRRSASNDSLRIQGDERASPRGFLQTDGATNGASPPSMWLSDSGARGQGVGGSSVPATIHAAMGAAADAVGMARSSLARIMQPSATAGFPPHSMAPGAFPQLAEPRPGSGSGTRPRVRRMPTAAGLVAMAAADPDTACDVETAVAIERVLRGCGHQRLDWFLMFDLQLWKEVRSGLRELYMATLMLDNRYKMKIALTFARNYPRLSRAFLTQDRAPEHSVLLFSVQLFTPPTLSASLVDHHRFMHIIIDVLRKFFVQPTPAALQRCGVILCDTESFRNRRYFHVFHDMRYLAGTPQVRSWVASHRAFLATYLGFIGLFQGMNPNRRAVLEHVEFEADTWVNAFNVTLQVAKSCRQFAECYGATARDLFFAMRGTLRRLHRAVVLMPEENYAFIVRAAQAQGLPMPPLPNSASDDVQLRPQMHTLPTLWGRQYDIVRYDMAISPVSFHHPLHWFMAELCQHVALMTDTNAHALGFASVRDLVFSALDARLDARLDAPLHSEVPYVLSPHEVPFAQREMLRILDYPVRVCVVMAQIRAGLWVRNGYVIRSQSHHYREVSLRENTYDQDIVMIQFFMSLWPDPDHILMTMLDRFGLFDWLSGRPHPLPGYEPTHMHYMVEEFLNLLIVLVSERHVATGKSAVDLARREIVHGCLSPISYSELTKKVPERLTELTEFDNLLQEMADYRGPLSVLDHGLYELKDELLDEVDPYFIHYSRNQREEVEELLRERLKKRLRKSGGDPDAVPAYFPPKLEPIRAGPFQRVGLVLHTPLACQILFYALLHATHTQSELLSETMVDEALQLIVIALEDGRRDAVAREIGGPDASSPATTGAQLPNADRGGLWKYALEQGYPSGRGAPLNLLGLVLTLGLKPEMKQWKPKLNYIYQLFREGGPRIVSCIDDYYANLEATPMGSRVLKSAMEETKAAERKKKAAQARQAAILAEFANRQNDFMNQYGNEYDDLSDDENYAEEGYEVLGAPEKGKSTDTSRVHKALWGAPSGACMVCQEECDSSKPYGMLSLVQTNRAIRNAPLADVTHIVDILRLPGGLDTTITHTSSLAPQSPEDTALPSPVKNTAAAAATIAAARLRSADNLGVISQMASGAYGAPSGLKSFPVLYHERGLAASTCGHVMHTRCFTQYCQGIEAKRQQQPTRNHPESLHRKEFLCPLCKSLGNVLLPSLPQSADFDPLVIADRNPDLFSQPASAVTAKLTTEFERWVQEDWKPFGETMDAIASDQIIRRPEPVHASNLASSSGGNVNLAGAGASASSARHGAAGPSAVSSSSVLPMAEQPAASGASAGIQSALSIDSAIGGLTSALRSPGNFSFNIADSLAESIPRLDALLRSAQRFPAGLTFQALLSRFLPQLGSGPLGMPPGVERMVLPLSQYVHWLVERQAAEHTHHQNYVQNRKNMHDQAQLRLARGIAGNDNDNDNADQYATPETSGNLSSSMPHLPAGNAALPERVAGDQEAKAREQMETYQFMYTRLYDVLQNVQRDNYVGLPSTSLFEHLYRSKDKGAAGASSHHHQHQHTSHASATAEQYAGRNYGEEDEDYEEDDDEEEDHYMYRGASGSGPPGPVGHNPEQPAASMPQFFQNIMEHLRVLSASSGSQAGMQSLTSSENASLSAQLHSASKMRPYPFDKATSSLFAHTIELFELSQRGIRNPPVFDHEDSRTLPSGTLLDAIPEAHAVFMHSLGKIPEIQYRTMFSPIANILRTSVDGSDSQAKSTSPAQRLRTLVLESQAGGVLPSAGLHGDFVARTRLEMLKELGYALSPLNGSHITRPRDLQNEQSRWATGDDGMPAKPFLMQDNFALLTDISLSLVIPFGLDIWQLVRLFVTAELVRACVAVGDSILGEYTGAPKGLRIAQNQPVDMGSNPPNIPPTVHSAAATTATAAANVAEAAAGQAPTAASCVPHSWVDAPEARDIKLLSLLSGGSDASLLQESSAGIYTLVSWAIRQLQGPECDEEALERLQSAVHPVTVTKLVTTLLLPFLRRIALLFYLQYGVDIAGEAPWLISERQCALGNEANPQVLSQSEPECVRLLKLLHLPDLDQILVPETQPHTLSLAEGWLRDLRNFRRRHTSPMSLGAGYTMAVPIGMPTLYSLVDLPDRFEILFERSAKAFCTLCNSVPNDPALCLLCGNFMCAQSFCCEVDGIGECNMHMKTCGGTVGIFLLVKKCGLVLLHHDNGCFMSAPYLDQHGEVDVGLKRGRPLFINRNRYAELKKLVLTQKIPVFVARKIDQAFDIGGWVSM